MVASNDLKDVQMLMYLFYVSRKIIVVFGAFSLVVHIRIIVIVNLGLRVLTVDVSSQLCRYVLVYKFLYVIVSTYTA